MVESKKGQFSYVLGSLGWQQRPQRVLGFALHALTRLLRYKGLVLFIDATILSTEHWKDFIKSWYCLSCTMQPICVQYFLPYDYKKQTGLQYHVDEHTIMRRWVEVHKNICLAFLRFFIWNCNYDRRVARCTWMHAWFWSCTHKDNWKAF